MEYVGKPIYATPVHDRIIIQVIDRDGRPVPNARVRCHEAGTTQMTHADRRTLFFPVIAVPDAIGIDRSRYTNRRFTAERDGFTGSVQINTDRDTEAVQLDQRAMGRFLFILYETGIQGDLETPRDVEQHTVNRLDDLVVKLVEREPESLGLGTRGGMKLNP